MDEKNTNTPLIPTSPGSSLPGSDPIEIKKEAFSPASIPFDNHPAGSSNVASPFSPPEPQINMSPKPDITMPSSNNSTSSSNDILSAIKTDTLGGDLKSNTESQNSQDNEVKIESSQNKKSNLGFFIIIAAILMIAAAAVSGVLVYSWQTTLLDPLTKDKALLQNQVSSQKSQLDNLQKEKLDLQAELDTLKNTPASPATPNPTTPPPAENIPAENPTTPTAPNPPAEPTPTPAPTGMGMPMGQ